MKTLCITGVLPCEEGDLGKGQGSCLPEYGFPPRLTGQVGNSQCRGYGFGQSSGVPEKLIALVRAAFPFVAIALVLGVARAYEYEVTGRLQYQGFTTDGMEASAMEKNFKVSVRGCLWHIRTSHRAPSHGGPEWWELGGDGVHVYELEHYGDQPRQVATRQPGFAQPIVTNIVISSAANVYPNPVPVPNASLASFIWLTYASQCYIASNRTSRLRQVWFFDDPNQQYTDLTLPANWAVTSDPPHLPETVHYFNEGKYYALKDSRSVVLPAPKPFHLGWSNAVFQVIQHTNVQGLRLPQEAVFLRFAPRHYMVGTSSNDLAIITKVKLSLHSARTNVALAELLPPMHSGQRNPLRDYRFWNELRRPITYSWSDKWLTMEEARETRYFASQSESALRILKEQEEADAAWAARRGYHLAILGALLILPVIVLLLSRSQQMKSPLH